MEQPRCPDVHTCATRARPPFGEPRPVSVLIRLIPLFSVAIGFWSPDARPERVTSNPAFVAAKQGVVVRVADRSGVPVPYALVWINGTPPRTADATGEVRFARGLPATFQVSVRRIGYAPHDTTVSGIGNATIRVTLNPVERELEAVLTVATRSTPLAMTGFYDRMERVRRGAIRGEFVTPEELEGRQIVMMSQIFQGRSLVSVQGGREAKLFGRGQCMMQVLIDGMPIEDNVPGRNVNVHDVMGVEIYGSTANAPAELIPTTRRGSCGIVAIWTGPRRF